MSMEDLYRAIELIESNSNSDFEGPKTEDLINKAETALGLRFPPTYRTFLAQLGCGDIGGLEIYGVIHDDFKNSGVPDAVWITLRERLDSALPNDLIIIGETGDGGYWVIKVAKKSGNEKSVVAEWVPGAKNDLENQIIADDFGEFLYKKVQNNYE